MSFWWQTFKHYNLRGYLYVWANLAFVALALPLLTLPAAWAALVRVSQLAQTTPDADINDFWEAFKAHIKQGLILGLISVLLVIINVSNLISYQGDNSPLMWMLRGLWIGTLFVWFTLQIYVWPLYYEMENPRLLTAYRNAIVMFLRNPFFTLMLWGVMLVIGALSSLLPAAWILLTFSLFGCISASATLNRLQAAGYTITTTTRL